MRALSRDPDSRYAKARDMANDLEEILRVGAYGRKNTAMVAARATPTTGSPRNRI